VEALTVVGDGDLFRGLSVSFLNGKLLELLDLTADSTAKIYDVEPRVRELSAAPLVCPRDGRPGCALVDVAPDDFAGRANIMISYGWGYNVLDIVTALAAYCARSKQYPKQVIVWICFACINQHRVKESFAKGISVPFKEFEQTFKERVTGIGKVVCLLSPWNDPLYVRRVWCVFELYTASVNPGIEIDLILPPRDADDFRNTLATEGLDKVWECLNGLRVEDANASVEEDKITILNLVRSGPGTDFVNQNVKGRLRRWFADMAVSDLQKRISNVMAKEDDAANLVTAAVSVVRYWYLQGAKMVEVAQFADDVLQFSDGTLGPNTKEHALAAGVVAWLAMLSSQFDKAIDMYEQILKVEEKCGGKATKEYGSTMYDLGWALCSKGDHKEAIRVLTEGKAIQAQVIGTKDVAYGRTVRDMGEAMIELEDFDSALEAYNEAVCTLEFAVGRYHPDTACALKHQSRVFVAKGDALTAISQLEEVLRHEEATIGTHTSDHAITRLILADALRAAGKLDRALYVCERCLPTMDLTLGRQTKFGAWTLFTRGRIFHDMSLSEEAQRDFEESLSIAESIAGKDSYRYMRAQTELGKLDGEEEMTFRHTETSIPWGNGDDDEEPVLSKFKELDIHCIGLVEFGELMKLVKTLLKRNLEENEIQALAASAQVHRDAERRVTFRAFQRLGRRPQPGAEHISEAIQQYFDRLIADGNEGKDDAMPPPADDAAAPAG